MSHAFDAFLWWCYQVCWFTIGGTGASSWLVSALHRPVDETLMRWSTTLHLPDSIRSLFRLHHIGQPSWFPVARVSSGRMTRVATSVWFGGFSIFLSTVIQENGNHVQYTKAFLRSKSVVRGNMTVERVTLGGLLDCSLSVTDCCLWMFGDKYSH